MCPIKIPCQQNILQKWTILTPQFSTKMLATVIMIVQYKIFHPIVLHIATSTDSRSIYSLNHLMCTTTPTEPRKLNMKLTFVSQYIFFTFSNILWQKTFQNASIYIHRSPLTLIMLSLTAGNISSNSPHYNFWHLMQEIAESSIGFKLLLSHTQPVHCVKLWLTRILPIQFKNPDMCKFDYPSCSRQ
jgi:hypothetical protein